MADLSLNALMLVAVTSILGQQPAGKLAGAPAEQLEQTITAAVGQQVRIHCSSSNAHSVVDAVESRDWIFIRPHSDGVTPAYVARDGSATVQFRSRVRTDAGKTGKYIIISQVVDSDAGTYCCYEKGVSVQRHSTALVVTKYVSVKLGNSISLSCYYASDVTSYLEWHYKPSAESLNEKHIYTTRRLWDDYVNRSSMLIQKSDRKAELVIKSAELTDTGTYTCVEDSTLESSGRHTVTVVVYVQSNVGNDVTFPCRLTSANNAIWEQLTPVQLKVYSNGALSSPFSETGRHHVNTTAAEQFDLTIIAVNESDAGLYRCTDDSGYGDYQTVGLVVSVQTGQSRLKKVASETRNEEVGATPGGVSSYLSIAALVIAILSPIGLPCLVCALRAEYRRRKRPNHSHSSGMDRTPEENDESAYLNSALAHISDIADAPLPAYNRRPSSVSSSDLDDFPSGQGFQPTCTEPALLSEDSPPTTPTETVYIVENSSASVFECVPDVPMEYLLLITIQLLFKELMATIIRADIDAITTITSVCRQWCDLIKDRSGVRKKIRKLMREMEKPYGRYLKLCTTFSTTDTTDTDGDRHPRGMRKVVIMDKKLFVLHGNGREIAVYDLFSNDWLTPIQINDLKYAADLAVVVDRRRRRHLFVADRDGRRVYWLTEDHSDVEDSIKTNYTPLQLSTTPADGGLLVLCHDRRNLYVYRPFDGKELKFSVYIGAEWYMVSAVQTMIGTYVVCSSQKIESKTKYRVFEVDQDGKQLRDYERSDGVAAHTTGATVDPVVFDRQCRLACDTRGQVLLADSTGQLVVLNDAKGQRLKPKRILLQPETEAGYSIQTAIAELSGCDNSIAMIDMSGTVKVYTSA